MSDNNPGTSPTFEIVLEQLLRCMTAAERKVLLISVLGILSQRDNDKRADASRDSESTQGEFNNPGLDDWMMSAWPTDWPGRELVELDNVGDPGAWLRIVFGEPISQVLFGWAWDDEANAMSLADEYLREIRRQGYPLPSDFGEAPCPDGWSYEDEQQTSLEFVAFLRHWRESILQAVERQNSSNK